MATAQKTPWRGVHLMAPRPEEVPLLNKAIEGTLAPLGVNLLILEVNYQYEYRSHPELRASGALSKADIRAIASTCRKHRIRLIPQFNCLGHQSWEKTTFPLLVKYPEFDETPHIPLDNPGIYCRSWCPLHPKVNDVVFALMDELIDAFEADAFHVGMDEVFLIASEGCPRCRGKNPADLFAKAVNDYHQHLAGKRKLTVLMWGDRLLDDAVMGYGKWEASQNGTAPAVDMIPKDIIICDWHYELRDEYPSVPFFQQKGFRVLPSSWRNVQAALALRDYARKNATEKMLGHLCTTWSSGGDTARALLDDPKASDSAKQAVQALKEVMKGR
ncbi:MAG: family 20 glycosylhydrolase [Armatimonadota bacterium]|nr:family 20 glycosylhydrolase [Armatimonadota bacterium]